MSDYPIVQRLLFEETGLSGTISAMSKKLNAHKKEAGEDGEETQLQV
jgi:hypothetical protein